MRDYIGDGVYYFKVVITEEIQSFKDTVNEIILVLDRSDGVKSYRHDFSLEEAKTK